MTEERRQSSPTAAGAARGKRGPKRPEVIAEQVKDWIVEQGLRRGDRLPGERELMERLRASKSTIREALKVLETQGLTTTRTGPGGGTFVAELSEDRAIELLGNYFFFRNPTVADIYALRKLLEPELAASVTGRLSDADFHRLQETMSIYAFPPRDLDEERRQRNAELDFHGILVDLCPNPVMAFMCRFLHGLLRSLTICRRIYETPNPDLRESGLSYQLRLIDALRREDVEGVRQTMYEHMCAAQRHMENAEAVIQNGFLRLSDWPGDRASDRDAKAGNEVPAPPKV